MTHSSTTPSFQIVQPAMPAVTQRPPEPKLPYLEHPTIGSRRQGTPPPPTTPDLFVFSDVLEELCYRASYRSDEASFSILIGGWYVGPEGPYVELEGFRDSVKASDDRTLRQYLSDHPEVITPTSPYPGNVDDALMVGFAWAQPKRGARLDPEHIILFNTYFNQPFHLALLLDATQDAFAFYQKDQVGLFHNTGFWLLDDASHMS